MKQTFEGRLLECGDGYEDSWLTVGNTILEHLLPAGLSYDTEQSCATIERTPLGPADYTGEPVLHNVPRWDWERPIDSPRCDFVFRDWGNVRITIEYLDDSGNSRETEAIAPPTEEQLTAYYKLVQRWADEFEATEEFRAKWREEHGIEEDDMAEYYRTAYEDSETP